MKITEDTIKHVATLSRLEFSDEEIGKFTEKYSSKITQANQWQEVYTKSVEETVKGVDRVTGFREDKPEHWQGKNRDTWMKNVPEKANGVIKVPVIIEKDDNE